MKHTTLTIIQLFAIVLYANAQTNSVCLVKYKDLKSTAVLGTHNHWFYHDKLILTREPNFKVMYMRGFPVFINNVMTTETDTIKYNKAFNEFINEQKENESKRRITIWMQQYNTDVQQMTYYDDNKRKNYIVIDSLEKMESWEILNDTLTILGFKCQKATINYKQDKFYAWFTTQLPYNAGPDYFRGLPGLILKVSNSYGNLGYEAIEIQSPYKGTVPQFNNLGDPISKKEWILIIREKNKKTYESMNNMMDQLKTPEGKESIINQYKKPTETQKP